MVTMSIWRYIYIYELSSEDRDTAKQQPPCNPVMGYDVMLQAAVAERSELECNGRLEEPVQVVIPDVIWLKDVRSTVACHATLISYRGLGLVTFRHYRVRMNQFLERVKGIFTLLTCT